MSLFSDLPSYTKKRLSNKFLRFGNKLCVLLFRKYKISNNKFTALKILNTRNLLNLFWTDEIDDLLNWIDMHIFESFPLVSIKWKYFGIVHAVSINCSRTNKFLHSQWKKVLILAKQLNHTNLWRCWFHWARSHDSCFMRAIWI